MHLLYIVNVHVRYKYANTVMDKNKCLAEGLIKVNHIDVNVHPVQEHALQQDDMVINLI